MKKLWEKLIYKIKFKNRILLLTPGPVLLSSSIKQALSQDMWPHRSKKFQRLLKEVQADLKHFFKTKEPVLILTSTGTGAMEASLSNTLSPEEEVLCVCSGKFGERWKEIAQAYKIKVKTLNVPWGQAVSPDKIEEIINQNTNIKALLISACETSTATAQPIQKISEIMKKHPHILFIVDAITGLGAMELPMDSWGVDILIASSQKSFGLPAGLSFIALSKKAWKAVESSSSPKYYFDLRKERKAQTQGQTAFSASVSLIRALKASLTLMKKQGLKNSILKCQTLKESTLAFCKEMELKPYSFSPANSVTAIQIPENLSAEIIQKNLQEIHGIAVAGGQGLLKGKILRIGHLGPLTFSDHFKALKALAKELKKQDSQFFKNKKTQNALYKAQKILEKMP